MTYQLATDIAQFSIWRHLYAAALLLLSLSVLYVISATWELGWQLGWQISWVWLVTVAILSGIIYFLALLRMRNQPLHMTLCDVNASRSEWQLLYAGYDSPVLWQAQMLSIQSLQHCVLLTFETQYPSVLKRTAVIWKDQVPADIWRRLKALSHR